MSMIDYPVLGKSEDDFTVIVKFADTLLRLKLVEHKYHTSEISSYIKICNFGQMMWSEYRDKNEIDN